jgi:hypothetical protein
VVEVAGGEGDEHHGVKAELGEATSGPDGGRRRLAPMGLGGRQQQSTMVVNVRGNKGEVGENILYSTRCRDKVGTTWGGAHRRVRLLPHHCSWCHA